MGVVINRIGEDVDGWIGFLMNSLMLFVRGWRSLNGFMIFGFFWFCI